MINPPPLQYVFFDFEQPDPNAWQGLLNFTVKWNKTHQSKFFSSQEGEQVLTLDGGIKDNELVEFQKEIQQLNKEIGLIWFVGIKDERRPEDFEQAPFIQILGESYYPSELILNQQEVFGEDAKCDECNKADPAANIPKQTLIINEAYLNQKNVIPELESAGVDLINLPNGGFLISEKVVNIMKENGIEGYELINVHSFQTNKASNQFFMLKAKKSITKPCPEHTIISESGICNSCGQILGSLLTHYFIRKSWLEDDSLFSRHPSGYSSIYLTNEFYQILKINKIKKLIPVYGIFKCEHLI